jgi:hypothetical protein
MAEQRVTLLLFVAFLSFAHGGEHSMAGSRGNKDRRVQALRRLMSERGDPGEMRSDLFNEIEASERYDDRAAAIVFACMVESALESAITKHFVSSPEHVARLFSYQGNEGCLANFAAKVAIGEALGIFDELMRKDLNVIRDVRNAFAHTQVKVTFDTEAIRLACNEIVDKVEILYYRNAVVNVDSPRKMYTMLAAKLHFYLTWEETKPLRFKESKIYSNLYPSRSSPDKSP